MTKRSESEDSNPGQLTPSSVIDLLACPIRQAEGIETGMSQTVVKKSVQCQDFLSTHLIRNEKNSICDLCEI